MDNISGIGNHPTKALVEKSRPLLSLSKTHMTLAEFKILDAYLARINSHNPDAETVTFEQGELENYLGVSRFLRKDLDERLVALMHPIDISTETNEINRIVLFYRAHAKRDTETGLWTIQLTCTPDAKKYIFNIDNIGYLRYRLKNVVNMTSRYTYIMFLYLLDNRFRKTWIVQLDDLKEILNCTAETYSSFKRFNDLVLKKCQKEIHTKTELQYEYIPIRKGRKIHSVQINIITVSDELKQIDEEYGNEALQLYLPFYEEVEADVNEMEYVGDLEYLLGSDACNNEFTPEQIRVIKDKVIAAVGYADHLDYCNYLISKYNMMNVYDREKKIKDRFKYLCAIIDKEIEDKK